MRANSRWPAALALVGCLLGLLFATYSTADYANHLDRQVHNLHCSFIPGAAATEEAEGCRVALYSPYAAVLKDSYWGGLPIALFALGAFAFLAGFAGYLLLAGARAPRTALLFFALLGSTPLIVSLCMLVISVTQLGTVCKTCAGIYVASLLVALGSIAQLLTMGRPSAMFGGTPFSPPTGAPPRSHVGLGMVAVWLAALGAATVLPATVYANSMPDHRPYLASCGTLARPQESHGALLKVATSSPKQQATFFEDPLCPTCKSLHERLVAEELYDNFQVDLALFPLDSTCNWMLDRDLHPGACMVSRAILCGDKLSHSARQVLDWAYAEQEYLVRAGKAGEGTLRAVIQQRWGDELVRCVDSPEATARLNYHLHFAVDNSIPLSTPQVYLDGTRFCDEDTDLGLRFALRARAPKLFEAP